MPSETGHAVNRASFEGLKEFVNSLGTHYQPFNLRLQRPALAQLAIEAGDVFDRAEDARNNYHEAVNLRAAAFSGHGPLLTRCLKSFRTSGAPARTIADVELMNQKVQGTRATPPPKAVEGAEAADARSVSQQSFNQLLANTEKLVAALAASSYYHPAEEDLRIDALKARIDRMKATNTAVIPAEAALTGALLRRDIVFYTPETGLVDTGLAVKEYIGSLDRKKVPEAAGAARFKFRNRQERLKKAGLA